MKKCEGLAFQGDISLLDLSKLNINLLPEGVIKIDRLLNVSDRQSFGYHGEKGLVLAQGESRQHYHAFRETEKVEMYELAANDNKRLFIVVKEPTALSHEEHDPIGFDVGIYELFFQYETTHENEYRKVAD